MGKFKLSAAASLALIGAIGLIGCGGGSDGSSSLAGVSSISGVVSDGPIKNAKVYLDENFNGEYDVGEPMAMTDAEGKYTLDVIPQEGVEYLLVAEGNATLETEDLEDNPTDAQSLTFTMFTNSKSSSNLNPTTFKTYLQSIQGDVGENTFITGYLNATETTDTDLFKNKLKNKDTDVKNVLKSVAHKYKAQSLNTTKEDLGLENNSQITFVDATTTLSNLDAQAQYQDKVVAKVGNLVVAKTIVEATAVNETSADIAEVEEGITISSISAPTSGTSPFYDGDTSNSPVSLKKPIFSSISDKSDKVKLVVGKKTALAGDNTVSITPYDSILEIPEYNQIKDMGYSVVVGSHIVVQNANGEKRPISEMNDIVVSGAVLHKNDGLTLSGLKYLYFDGTTWIDNTVSGADTFNGLSSSFKLVPYVLVSADTTNNGLKDETLEVPGLSLIKNPVVVAKGKATSSTPSKILGKEVTDDLLILDASLDITGDNVTFKVPDGFTIEELVIVDEDLNKLTKNASIKTAVGESIDLGLTLANEQQKIDLTNTFQNGLTSTPFEAFDIFFAPTAQTAEEEEFNTILKENFKRFLMSSTTTNKDEFYNTTSNNSISFVSTYDSYEGGVIENTTNCTFSTNAITCTESEKEDGVVNGGGNFSFTFTPGKVVATGDWSENEVFSEGSYTIKDTLKATYTRQAADNVNVNFNASYAYTHQGSGSVDYPAYAITQTETVSGIGQVKLNETQEIEYVNNIKYNLDVKGTSSSSGSPSSWSVNGVSTYLRDSSLDEGSYVNPNGIFHFEGTYNLPSYSYNGYSMLKGKALLNGTYSTANAYDALGLYTTVDTEKSLFQIESTQEYSSSSSSSPAMAKQK